MWLKPCLLTFYAAFGSFTKLSCRRFLRHFEIGFAVANRESWHPISQEMTVSRAAEKQAERPGDRVQLESDMSWRDDTPVLLQSLVMQSKGAMNDSVFDA